MIGKETYTLLGKGIHSLFVLTIVNVISGLFANDSIVPLFPSLYLIATLISCGCTIGYGCILIKLGVADDQYKTAGILSLVCSGAELLVAMMGGLGGVALLISIVILIGGFFAEYSECMAHSYMLKGIDDIMSYRWVDIWKWFLGGSCALLAGTIMTIIIPILGALAVLIASIVLVGVSIWKMSTLNNTSKFFKGYSTNPEHIL